MKFNTCEVCGANGGRAGMLIQEKNGPAECINCRDTRVKKKLVIHVNLPRTMEEIERIAAILNQGENKNDRS